MNLLEWYQENPGSYHLMGAAGAGKTTSLQYMSRELLKQEYQLKGGAVIVPIYLKMAELNTRRIEADALYNYIGSKYFETCTPEVLDRMFAESVDYRFVLLLDGANEVLNHTTNGVQSVYSILENDIHQLLAHPCVDIIVTTRENGEIFNGSFSALFQRLYLCPLNRWQILRYMGTEESNFDNSQEEMVSNPMLLRMFRRVYNYDRARAVNLKNKYQLMKEYFSLDVELKQEKERIDDIIKVRRYILEQILPYMAYETECWLLGEEQSEPSYEEVLDGAMEKAAKCGYHKEVIQRVLQMMDLVGENLIFSHDLIREYLALEEWNRRVACREKGVEDFLKQVISQIQYQGTSDLTRRTRHLDLAELFIGCYETGLIDRLKEAGSESENARILTQSLYQEIAGVYDDLGRQYGTRAMEYGWKAVGLLEGMRMEDNLEMAEKLNFLFYCTLKGKKESSEDPLKLLNQAESLVKVYESQENDEKQRERVYRLHGKIISNKGAYYYSENYGNDLEEAIRWHKEALDYREKRKLKNDVYQSYRTLMSDYWKIQDYKTSYNYYQKLLEGMLSNLGTEEKKLTKLSEYRALGYGEVRGLASVVERGMGSELGLLKQSLEEKERAEIEEELCAAIPYVFEEFSDSSRRSDRDTLKSLKDKLDKLQDLAHREELKIVVQDYLKKCKEILGEE
ncbi:MAG: NACHT domain-containing protein [Lachnospiraceae bacterium]|nr:NACHT domain-containing protein [Lachnospiraceae bacterium]